MNTNNPKISILCPSFNHGKYMKFFLESVLNQTEQDFELIIVDDCSTDNNVAEIKKFNDPRIKLFQHKYNQGINAGLNTAFKNSSGKYCVFIASDDMLEPNCLEVSSEFLANNPKIGAFYPSLNPIDENNNEIKESKEVYNYKYREQNKLNLLRGCFLMGNMLLSPGMALRRNIFEELYPLALPIIQYQDYKMHVDIMLKYDIHLSEQSFVKYRLPNENTGISARESTVILREEYETDELMSTFLKIEDVKLLKDIFKDEVEKIGEPTKETIPYFLGRIALLSNLNERKRWGYQTIMKFIANQGNFDLLQNLYKFNFKTFLDLAKIENNSNIGDLEKMRYKKQKYKKLFEVILVVACSLLAVIVCMLGIFAWIN